MAQPLEGDEVGEQVPRARRYVEKGVFGRGHLAILRSRFAIAADAAIEVARARHLDTLVRQLREHPFPVARDLARASGYTRLDDRVVDVRDNAEPVHLARRQDMRGDGLRPFAIAPSQRHRVPTGPFAQRPFGIDRHVEIDEAFLVGDATRADLGAVAALGLQYHRDAGYLATGELRHHRAHRLPAGAFAKSRRGGIERSRRQDEAVCAAMAEIGLDPRGGLPGKYHASGNPCGKAAFPVNR